MERTCGNCLERKPHGKDMVYCVLFGIFISACHRGCLYHKVEVRGQKVHMEGDEV